MHVAYLDAIKTFEGFTAKANWDYAQHSNGFGTKAKFAGEVIDKAEANRRFQGEIGKAQAIVDAHLPNLDDGTRAAMTSLTFNAGTAWVNAGLGQALRTGDLETAREIFQQYNKAGGQVLPGLVERRSIEATWIGGSPTAVPITAQDYSVASNAVSKLGQSTVAHLGNSSIARDPASVGEPGISRAQETNLDSGLSPLRFNRLPTSVDWQNAADLRLNLNLDYSIRNQDNEDSENNRSWRDSKTYL